MTYTTKLSRWYVKHMIKSPILYYLFIALGVTGFLVFSANTKMSIKKTMDAEMSYKNNVFFVNPIDEIPKEPFDYIYIYIEKNKEISFVSDFTIYKDQILINESANKKLYQLINKKTANVKVEIPIDKISLLEKIFIRGGVSR